jgi:hypothetical protein
MQPVTLVYSVGLLKTEVSSYPQGADPGARSGSAIRAAAAMSSTALIAFSRVSHPRPVPWRATLRLRAVIVFPGLAGWLFHTSGMPVRSILKADWFSRRSDSSSGVNASDLESRAASG